MKKMFIIISGIAIALICGGFAIASYANDYTGESDGFSPITETVYENIAADYPESTIEDIDITDVYLMDDAEYVEYTVVIDGGLIGFTTPSSVLDLN